MLIPHPRGELSAAVLTAMRAPIEGSIALPAATDAADAALVLWCLYELHYRGFEDAPDELEWNPFLLGVRAELERDFERSLRERHRRSGWEPGEGDFAESLFAAVADHDGLSLAAHVQTQAGAEEVLELIRQRSIYHLKESDPTAWVIPRLSTVPKAALMELVYDEYGNGDPRRLHHQLFTRGMEGLGLDAGYGAYIDEACLEVLEQNNAMSFFGLHRRLRGAALGHLAAFEATSSLPSRRMAQGLERLGLGPALQLYYREHIEADAVHEQLAVRTICGSLVAEDPSLVEDVHFGAFTCLDLEDRFARHLLTQWGALPGRSEETDAA